MRDGELLAFKALEVFKQEIASFYDDGISFSQ